MTPYGLLSLHYPNQQDCNASAATPLPSLGGAATGQRRLSMSAASQNFGWTRAFVVGADDGEPTSQEVFSGSENLRVCGRFNTEPYGDHAEKHLRRSDAL